MAKVFAAILINPMSQDIRTVETDGSLKSLYALLGCDIVERVQLKLLIPHATATDHLWVDEEGLIRPKGLGGFKMILTRSGHTQYIAGRGLILRDRGEGVGPTKLTIAQVSPFIRWQ
jgi:hypothetical protein